MLFLKANKVKYSDGLQQWNNIFLVQENMQTHGPSEVVTEYWSTLEGARADHWHDVQRGNGFDGKDTAGLVLKKVIKRMGMKVKM